MSFLRGVTDRFGAFIRTLRRLEFHQIVFLLVLSIAALSVLAFIQLAEKVNADETRTVEERIIRMFRVEDDPSRLVGPPVMLKVVRDITALGGETVISLVVVLVTGYLVLSRRYRILTLVLIATLGGMILMVVFKNLFVRMRPDVVPALMDETTFSFPSGHSVMSAVVYLTLGSILAATHRALRMRIFIFASALLVAVLVGVSRVMLGVHYPLDVLAGWSLGLGWASLCWFGALVVKYGKRVLPRPRREDPSRTGQTGR